MIRAYNAIIAAALNTITYSIFWLTNLPRRIVEERSFCDRCRCNR
jgi:hypothetical protein